MIFPVLGSLKQNIILETPECHNLGELGNSTLDMVSSISQKSQTMNSMMYHSEGVTSLAVHPSVDEGCGLEEGGWLPWKSMSHEKIICRDMTLPTRGVHSQKLLGSRPLS